MIQQFLPALETEIKQQQLGETPNELYDPIRYLMQLGGKRIRPVLCLLTYSLQSGLAEDRSYGTFHRNFSQFHADA